MDQGSHGRGRVRLETIVDGTSHRAEAGVRWSRVKAARARIAAGFYDRADVREKLLHALLDALTDR